MTNKNAMQRRSYGQTNIFDIQQTASEVEKKLIFLVIYDEMG